VADVIVRAAGAADAPEVARIYVAAGNAGYGRLAGTRPLDDALVARWRIDLAPAPTRWWVAEDPPGAVVGFAGAGPSRDPVEPGLGELDTIAVDPARWRTGVGGALMAVALAALAERFDAAIAWTVAGYDEGRAFYEATGWAPDGGTRAGGREVSFRHPLGRAR
jgi:GNAT superfamily N-acetyltransferase